MSGRVGDGLPWYRHVWPWVIVGLLAVSMTGTMTIVVLAYSGGDMLVRDDWYADGVSINRTLERFDAARARGIRAVVHFDPEHERLAVTLTGEGTDELESLNLLLSHATRADRDRTVKLSRVAVPGRYEARFSGVAPGRWYLSLEPGDGPPGSAAAEGAAWRLQRAFYAGSGGSVELGGEG